MVDTGYCKDRDAPHQALVKKLIEDVTTWGWVATDVQTKGLAKWAPDVRVCDADDYEMAWIDVKARNENYACITIASEEQDYQLTKAAEYDCTTLVAFRWNGLWLAADGVWLAQHQRGREREPTGNGSKTKFRIFGPVESAPVLKNVLHMLGQRYD